MRKRAQLAVVLLLLLAFLSSTTLPSVVPGRMETSVFEFRGAGGTNSVGREAWVPAGEQVRVSFSVEPLGVIEATVTEGRMGSNGQWQAMGPPLINQSGQRGEFVFVAPNSSSYWFNFNVSGNNPHVGQAVKAQYTLSFSWARLELLGVVVFLVVVPALIAWRITVAERRHAMASAAPGAIPEKGVGNEPPP